MPEISVIVPVYRVEHYIVQCVDSILSQTYSDFELILVDDGSPDNSGSICDEYAKKDKRIRVIHQSNAGVSAARNAGLEEASGKYISWVDSDDIIEVDMFQHMLCLAYMYQADIVQCQHDRACELNNAERSDAVVTLNGEEFVRRIFTKQSADYTNQVSLCSKLFRKELFDEIRFPVGQVYEDEMQTYKVCLSAKTIVETGAILYHYVKRENSIITGETHKKLLDKQKALEDRLSYLPKKLPDLDEACCKSFLGFSKQILCRMYQQEDNLSVQQGTDMLLKHANQLYWHMSKYDRLYLPLLKNKYGRHWVLSNDFEPIQSIIRKIKFWN